MTTLDISLEPQNLPPIPPPPPPRPFTAKAVRTTAMQPHTTVTAALNDIGFGKAQALLLFYCGLAWLADALETMLLSFLGPAIHCAWGVGPASESLLSSVVFVGMLAGVYVLGLVSDQYGRRRGFLASALLLGAAAMASAAAPSFGWLLALRGVVGFALGGAPIAVTLFAEFCTTDGRGRWLLVLQAAWTIGTVLEVLLAWAVLPKLGWRWLLALSALPLGLLLLLYPYLPESPHWLYAQKRYAEAEAVLHRVAAINGRKPLLLMLGPSEGTPSSTAETLLHTGSGSDGRVRSRSPANAVLATARLTGVPDGHALVPSVAARWRRDLLRTCTAAFATIFGPELRRTTLLLYGIWSVNALTYYGLVLLTTSLQTASKDEACTPNGAPNLSAGDYMTILIATLAEAPGLLAAALLIDSKGRKWALQAGLCVCSAALGCLLLDPPSAGQLALLFVARGCIEASYSVLYVYSPEVYPTPVRSVGLALCNGFSRLGGFMAPFATVFLVESGRPHDAEALLGSLCACAALCALLLPYETRGCDLQRTKLSEPPLADDEQADAQVPSGRTSGAGKPSKMQGKMGFAANEGEEEDLFAEFDLGELEGGAAAPIEPEQAGDADTSKVVDLSSPAATTAAKAVRPPLHPGQPVAVQQQQADPGMGQHMCPATEPATLKEQQQGQGPVQEAAMDPPAAAPTALADGGENIPPAPNTQTTQHMPAPCARVAEAAAAAPLETQPPPSSRQPGTGSTLAAHVTGKAAMAAVGVEPGKGSAVSPAVAPAVHIEAPAAATTGTDASAGAAQHQSADCQAARQGLPHSPAPAPKRAPAPKPSLLTNPSKPAVLAHPVAAALPTPGAAPRRAAPSVLTPTPLASFGGVGSTGSGTATRAATPSPTFRLQGIQARLPGAGTKAPSRLNPQAPGATFAALTPVPVTPAGFPAAAVASAASEQRAQQAAQTQQAAVLADEVLSFSFDAAVARVLGGHQERVQESLALAEPMAEEVQQGVLALEQLGLQSEALRRQLASLGVDLTIYRSSLAFMDSPVQAQSFSAATRKADALWSELSAYQPPSIQHLLPAQTPELPPGGSEGDCCMADSPAQVGSGGKAGAREGDGQAPGGEDVLASECEAMDSQDSPVQPRALEAAFNRGNSTASGASGGEESSSLGSQPGTASHDGALEAALSLEAEQEGAQGLLPDTEVVPVAPAAAVPPTQEEEGGAQGMEVDGWGAGGGGGELCVSLVLTAAADSVTLSIG
ncbi:Organic cation/carnitine transporter 7 [Chlorella vulgaris]